MKILSWFWQQNPPRGGYTADTVNRWAEGITRCLTIEHKLAVVTDTPDGIDPSIEVIPMPTEFLNVRNSRWSEGSGLPQCYRRLFLFSPEAGEYFGDDDLVSMDLDAIFVRNMDHLFAEHEPFRMFGGTSRDRPYNGSMVRIRSGARRQVYDQFAADPEGVAAKARAMYIGSDQAVISMVLGPGEKTWTEADGVYFFKPKYQRIYRDHTDPPANLTLMFFPGHVKPWDQTAMAIPWMADAWRGKRGPLPPAVLRAAKPARLRAYRDPKGWGEAFAKAANARGHMCSMFTQPRFAPTGVAFVRLDQQGAQREISRRIVADLNARGVRTLPTAQEGRWYDDKAAQLEVLYPWMPRTVYFRDQRMAEMWLKAEGTFPLVSKSIDGAGSQGVRLLASRTEAQAELRAAFQSPGIRSVYDRWQLGYVYWQEFVPDQPCDYRVCVVGGYVYGLVRSVRPGDFRASGSGVFRHLTLADERECAAAALAVKIAAAIKTQWMAFDIVFGQDGTPLVLEMSSAWTMKAYADCPCFTRNRLARTARTGADSFAIAVEVMEQMACEPAA